jgi:hypothetical protein
MNMNIFVRQIFFYEQQIAPTVGHTDFEKDFNFDIIIQYQNKRLQNMICQKMDGAWNPVEIYW